MGQRLVVPAMPATTPSAGEGAGAAVPTVSDIRLVYGVGASADAPPDEDSFRRVYTVSMPVFSLGGLDPDGIHEFDAQGLLRSLQQRASRRRWGLRLELEVTQSRDAASASTLTLEPPAEAPSFDVAGRSKQGTTLPGGGRTLVLTSAIVHAPDQVARLAGSYRLTTEGQGGSAPERRIAIGLGKYEFEG